mmetsp:Transcript_3187/g.11528  ORF Transcript_3187/g.11528 Transcript_3187/m.11528 type:complete len:710 (-) Transcript_3187:55-2184(-)
MPPKKGRGRKSRKPKGREEAPADARSDAVRDRDDGRDVGADFALPETRTIIPEDQVKLSEKEMDEDVTRVLTANDPNVPANIIVFHYKDREYKRLPPGPSDHVVCHFAMEGSAMHVNSEEAKVQVESDRVKREAEEERKKMSKAEAQAEGKYDKDMHAKMELMKVAKNQFNFSDRAAQTFNMGIRHKIVSTKPPLAKTFAANFTQWDIYDEYMKEFEQQQAQAAAGREKGRKGGEDEPPEAAPKKDLIHSASMGRSLKVLERMVNQNEDDEVYQDFKYWEDASDQFREGMGSLLPLWRFQDTRVKRKMVTGIAWNPVYADLLAVSYGNYDFMKQGSGLICVYSLKNTSHPEFMFTTDSGVMCLDFHPQHHALLAVGCYDGTVKVFDVRKKENTHIFVSDIKTGKHTDPVWQVSWQEEDLAKDLNFFSVSSDGRVANWIMSKNELKMETVMLLKLVTASSEEPDEETSLTGLAGGSCFDFNRMTEHLFIVGTEEGRIHKCSKAYSGQYLETYVGHHMAVYAVRWNPFHPRVFLSCSADWTVKLWDHRCPTPIMSFDVSTAVGDIDWAPYSSTVFACVTADGRVLVYDLMVNKHGALCNQKVVKKAKLTHVRFNATEAILLVGDEKGMCNSLKLSPNLRLVTQPPKSDVPLKKGEVAPPPPSRLEIEIGKINSLLASADAAVPVEESAAELAAAAEGKGKAEAEAEAPAAV